MATLKRFYQGAAIKALEAGGFTVALDGKPIMTPGRKAFTAPRAIASAAAEEWAAQAERIEPATMPITRAVNTAIERIAPARDAHIDQIAAYAETDLVCYRAEEPAALVAREAEAWDPLVAWAADALGAPLTLVAGVSPKPQPEAAIAAIRDAVARHDDLGLAALSELTALSGSVVIGLATAKGRLAPADAWAASRVDERWQAELWGEDAEAAAVAALKQRDFLAAARLSALLRGDAA